MSLAATDLNEVTLPPQPARRHDLLWVLVPVFFQAYLWIATFWHPDLAQAHSAAKWGPLLVACCGMCLLLLARTWVMRLPGAIGRTPLRQFCVGISGGAVMLATIFTLAWRQPAKGASPDVFALGEWVFTESIAFLLALAWCKVRSLPRQFANGELLDATATAQPRVALRDYALLAKLNLNALVLFTTFAGFFMASPGPLQWGLLLRTLVGTGLVAWGASALNQFIERDVDALMRRTAGRPLPARRITTAQAVDFGVGLALLGLAVLALTVNILTAAIAAATLAVYLFLYTPLKRINSLSTLAGAISGALPPVIGWTAVRDFNTPALVLFSILFLWQIPHFLAIAWKYRDQYAEAGFPLYSVQDARGRATGIQCALYTLALAPISLLTSSFGLSGPFYLVLGGVIGIMYLALSIIFALQPTRLNATRLFLASLIYLPAVLGAMLGDHWFIRSFGL